MPSDTNWQGPIKSKYGVHIVMLSKQQASEQSSLAKVQGDIRGLLQHKKQLASRDKAVEKLLEKYTIDVKQPIRRGE